MSIVAIAVHKTMSKIIGIRLLDDETGQIKDVTLESVVNALSNSIGIKNLRLENGKLVSCNGSLSRYAVLSNGMLIGKSPLVVLMEFANGDYKVSDFKGQIERLSSEEAVRYAMVEGIANGKVVIQDGKEYISSINGTYDKEEVLDIKAATKRVKTMMRMIGKNEFEFNDNGDMSIKSVANLSGEIVIPNGIVSIDAGGCAGLQEVTKIVLPDTVRSIGEKAFSGCVKLKEINIPYGVSIIKTLTFEHCHELKEITIPKSVNKIEANAFMWCRGLKVVHLENRGCSLVSNSFPRGCRIKRE